jgi:hypothetical protein
LNASILVVFWTRKNLLLVNWEILVRPSKVVLRTLDSIDCQINGGTHALLA